MSKEKKKELNAEEIYKKNQCKAKFFKNISPIVFWGCLAISLICLFFAVRNSFGNIAEICNLLDSKKYNDLEIERNYYLLIDKYGEWIIGTAGNGFTITFINIGKALFSGLMIINCILSVLFLVSAYLLGKWAFPHLASQILIDNQDMVNLTILKNNKG
jgi:hypothetical protein